tara:strand:+ start:56 stop:256 length:201 start_codon:yes stop_codon:yes gene_type:complete
MYLKYITPKKPHQNDPRAVKYIPFLKLLFIKIKFKYYIIDKKNISFLVEFNYYPYKYSLTERWLSG